MMSALFSTSASLLSVVLLLPQLIRLWRTGDLRGISSTWPALGLSLNLWWSGYLVHARLPAMLPASVIVVVLYATVVVLVGSIDGRERSRMAVRAGLANVACAALLAWGGWTLLGLGLGTAYAVQLLPAVITAWRSESVAGVSAATWWIALAEAAIWGAFGATNHDGPTTFYGVTGAVAAAAMLERLRREGSATRGKRSRQLSHALPDEITDRGSLGVERPSPQGGVDDGHAHGGVEHRPEVVLDGHAQT